MRSASSASPTMRWPSRWNCRAQDSSSASLRRQPKAFKLTRMMFSTKKSISDRNGRQYPGEVREKPAAYRISHVFDTGRSEIHRKHVKRRLGAALNDGREACRKGIDPIGAHA